LAQACYIILIAAGVHYSMNYMQYRLAQLCTRP